MPSIEILVPDPSADFLCESDYKFAVLTSSPPISHRDPSLWQKRFDKLGGVLVHLGAPDMKANQKGLFFAYDLINEEDCSRFKFKSEYLQDLKRLFSHLISSASRRTIIFTTDWEFGSKQLTVRDQSVPSAAFLKENQQTGTPFNCWIPISNKSYV